MKQRLGLHLTYWLIKIELLKQCVILKDSSHTPAIIIRTEKAGAGYRNALSAPGSRAVNQYLAYGGAARSTKSVMRQAAERVQEETGEDCVRQAATTCSLSPRALLRLSSRSSPSLISLSPPDFHCVPQKDSGQFFSPNECGDYDGGGGFIIAWESDSTVRELCFCDRGCLLSYLCRSKSHEDLLLLHY